MLTTTTTLQGHALVLTAGLVTLNGDENKGIKVPKLLGIDWHRQDKQWSESKSLALLYKHFKREEKGCHIDTNSLSINNPVHSVLLTTLSQLEEYISGNRQEFDLQLYLSVGTEFQQKVWQALKNIPYGETISYSQLAQNIDKPTAYRAVANANGKNPFSIVIPCHRVIASDGGLGGYTGGIDKKRWLLQIEKQSKASSLNTG